ncbi:SETMAR [Cordylochernes scorpioides]|uniref:SETMAR n=1 Tax=Cordylochernes scorpioides TaxID=51811 RepID=A0ABY6KR93_9ARAC|nr:SETMAR [Cordylochernes scorpioides]
MLEEVYSDHALSKSQCYRWFKKFQSGDFELDNEPHGKPPQKFEDAELQVLLDEDSTQMQEKLAKQLQKSSTDGHRLLCEAYGKHALSIKSCEYWFRRFKSGEFDTRDKERGGRPIKFEDAELEALLDEDSSQTQEEFAETLGVTQQAISNRLKVMGMVQKQGNWVPYELKPGNIERRICTCELLLKRQNRKGFLHRIVTGDERWIHYDNPKRRKSWVKPGHASTSTAKPNIHGKKLMLCIWWDQLGVIYYELLQPNETITGERYQQQLMRLSRALKIKRPLYAKRHDKVIYQHDNARPHVAKVVKETLKAL